MPNPNDPALEAQVKDLGQQLDQKREELAAAPDDQKAGIQAQIDVLEQQRRDLQPQRQAAREENRESRPQGGQGQGRETAPGQVKKQ